ncbi:MAG: DUF4331 domain-containing protein [Actinomycetes bacterium]
MSSHREAPEISKDPVADNTDLYAFVSPDAPNTVTLIANFIPLQGPDAGPNFYEFGDDVKYAIHIDNNGDGQPDVSYWFTFTTKLRSTDTFLYNTGPITSLTSTSWNRRQFAKVVREDKHGLHTLGSNLACPPCNIGPRSTPNFASLAAAATHNVGGGVSVYTGQRSEGFFVDLGSIFDLGTLRPFQSLHLIPSAAAVGVNGTKDLNVHSIAIRVPIAQLTSNGKTPSDPADPKAVLGVWSAAYRHKVTVRGGSDGQDVGTGPWVQVSRLGNPLFNEVIVPMADKDRWNLLPPSADSAFAQYVTHPELAGLLPVLYPGVFPHLAAYSKPRADLAAILLTGIPAGVIGGFQNFTGTTQADMLRLNVAIPPSSSPSQFGLLGGDLAGFPNGRRVADNIVAIELRAIAGVTIPLVDPSFTPDGAAGLLTDGNSPASLDIPYLSTFPYLGLPHSGYETPAA